MGDVPRTQLLAYAAAAVLLVVAGAGVLRNRGEPANGGARLALDGAGAGTSAGETAGGPGGSGAGRLLYVHVAGAVRHPGVYRLPPGARVAAAVRRAGGMTRRAAAVGLNLAARLEDGQQVVVPVKGQVPPGAPGGAPASAGAGGPEGAPAQPVQLSTATLEQLDGLDGIGPTLARRILEYRDKHGGFKSVEELREVDGIGEKRFAALREAVRP